MARRLGIGARDQVAIVGVVREARPYLLPVDDEGVAVVDRTGGERRQVGSRAGLAHAEAEDQLAAHDRAGTISRFCSSLPCASSAGPI